MMKISGKICLTIQCHAQVRCLLNSKGFIVALLENLGLFIDPFRVISRIPNGLKIPNLKPALLQVLRDLGTQISLREGCKEILFGDTIELLESINKLQSKGLVVEGKLLNRHSCKSISTLLYLC